MNFNNPDDFSSSPESSLASDDTGNQTFATADGNIDFSDDSDNDLIEDDGTMIERIDEDLTGRSTVSPKSNASSSTSSSSRLEAALRQAAEQAGTQGIEYDENGDLTMEMVDEEITASFKPWVDQALHKSKSAVGLNRMHDRESMNPFSPAFKANLKAASATTENQEETMDFTHAVGKILHQVPSNQASPDRGRRKLEVPSGHKIYADHSSTEYPVEDSLLADETMDLTTTFGGIQQKQSEINEDETRSVNENEELTMDFTSALGGVIDQDYQRPFMSNSSAKNDHLSGQAVQEGDQRTGGSQAVEEEEMDMTMAVGGILETITERTEPDEDQTFTMEITTAIGSILPKGLTTNDRSMAKVLMECETDAGQLASSPFRDERVDEPLIKIDEKPDMEALTSHSPAFISETGSPKLISSNCRRSARGATNSAVSTIPKPSAHQLTPSKKPSTPSKHITPKPTRPTIPSKTPPSKNVTLRTSSPKKLFKAEIKRSAGTPKRSNPVLGLDFDAKNGAALPNIILTPQRRRSSGLGIDKEGLGSPKLAEILDRRGSIGEHARAFTPQGAPSKVRFEDPRAMEREVERECAEIQRYESGRGILQMEADMHNAEEEKSATANLKEMIESLTPKKNRLKGRKSLHVGAARGLLGKRPVELDEDEEEDEHTSKRLKGRESSPVKNVKLLAPPSKAETTGRTMKVPRFSLGESSGNGQLSTPKTKGSPAKTTIITTPKDQGRFKDAETISSAMKPPTPFDQKLAASPRGVVELTEEDDRIHLQEFLNMTSIRFMELTTTKRRHTIAPINTSEDSVRIDPSDIRSGLLGKNDRELEDCVVAGACIVPMLELYQHVSCFSSIFHRHSEY